MSIPKLYLVIAAVVLIALGILLAGSAPSVPAIPGY